MTSIEWINRGLEVVGAAAALLGAISHLPLGKFSAACGELGTDIAGFVSVIRGKSS